MAAAKGARNTGAKITEAQARAILEDKRPPGVVAAAYGITPVQVWRIRTGLRWGHLQQGGTRK